MAADKGKPMQRHTFSFLWGIAGRGREIMVECRYGLHDNIFNGHALLLVVVVITVVTVAAVMVFLPSFFVACCHRCHSAAFLVSLSSFPLAI